MKKTTRALAITCIVCYSFVPDVPIIVMRKLKITLPERGQLSGK